MIELSGSIAIQGATVARDTARDEDFAALVSRQSQFTFRVAYSVLRNSHDAEDVVQEVFLKLYRSGQWREIVDERAFLARATWRMALDRMPKRKSEPAGEEIVAAGQSPESAAIAKDWNATVRRLMDALPEELRQPLALSAIEEMSSRQIGEVMQIAEATVRTRLMRARQILKQKLAALRGGAV